MPENVWSKSEEEQRSYLSVAMEWRHAIVNGLHILMYPVTHVPAVIEVSATFSEEGKKRAKRVHTDKDREAKLIGDGAALASAFMNVMKYCGHSFPCEKCGSEKFTKRKNAE